MRSPRHDALRQILMQRRHRAGLSQAEVANRLKRGQTFVSAVERGQHRVTVVEFLEICEAIGFDPHAVIRRLKKH
jgi:transcriptional regulator with XRE-family HTH domain